MVCVPVPLMVNVQDRVVLPPAFKSKLCAPLVPLLTVKPLETLKFNCVAVALPPVLSNCTCSVVVPLLASDEAGVVNTVELMLAAEVTVKLALAVAVETLVPLALAVIVYGLPEESSAETVQLTVVLCDALNVPMLDGFVLEVLNPLGKVSVAMTLLTLLSLPAVTVAVTVVFSPTAIGSSEFRETVKLAALANPAIKTIATPNANAWFSFMLFIPFPSFG